jgi:hypothetical protein
MIMNMWSTGDPQQRAALIAHGKKHFKRFNEKKTARRIASTVGGHLYVFGGKPDATISDIVTVNEQDPHPPGEQGKPPGAQWVFERTIYQNLHRSLKQGGDSQRIIHLFALIHEGQIIKVSDCSNPGLMCSMLTKSTANGR